MKKNCDPDRQFPKWAHRGDPDWPKEEKSAPSTDTAMQSQDPEQSRQEPTVTAPGSPTTYPVRSETGVTDVRLWKELERQHAHYMYHYQYIYYLLEEQKTGFAAQLLAQKKEFDAQMLAQQKDFDARLKRMDERVSFFDHREACLTTSFTEGK